MKSRTKTATAVITEHFILLMLRDVRDVLQQASGVFLHQAFWWRVVSFPIFLMGQYFVAVNKTKKEFICPWCVGGCAKLWEWAANPWGGLFTILLRQSDATGGGDYGAGPPKIINLDSKMTGEELTTMIGKLSNEGDSFTAGHSIVGSWAGDHVVLVGDYDSSGLFKKAFSKYRNVSEDVVTAWNVFMDIEEMQLAYNSSCSCRQTDE